MGPRHALSEEPLLSRQASGERWLAPTDEPAEAKRKAAQLDKFTPMSARKMRIANKAARERELWQEQQTLWEEQCRKARPLWEQAFDDCGPEDWAHDEYARWTWEGRPGETAEVAHFIEASAFNGSWLGWVFKTGSRGLGYYKDGVKDDQLGGPEGEVALSDLLPITLKLDGLLADEGRMRRPWYRGKEEGKARTKRRDRRSLKKVLKYP